MNIDEDKVQFDLSDHDLLEALFEIRYKPTAKEKKRN